MTSVFSTEKSNSVVVKPSDRDLYEIKTDNNRWETVDLIFFGKTAVNIKSPSTIENVTLEMITSLSHGLVAVFEFHGEPNIHFDKD